MLLLLSLLLLFCFISTCEAEVGSEDWPAPRKPAAPRPREGPNEAPLID